jgi:hypothetical protein
MNICKYFLFIIILINLEHSAIAQNTLIATYTYGDIPTSLLTYNETCNGSSTRIHVTLPVGDNFEVTSTVITYTMTATLPGFMADQRSKLICYNTGLSETEAAGAGNSAGTMAYSRTTSVANGSYPGETEISFNIYAKRNYNDGAGLCTSATNKINNGTLSITVHYSNEIKNPKVGINTTDPEQTFEVNGKLRLGNDNTAPLTGTMRFNPATLDFEGYNGSKWLSFTQNSNGQSAWGSQSIHENKNLFRGYTSASNELYGSSVSIDENHAVISSPAKNVGSFAEAGIVIPFEKINGLWTQSLHIEAPTSSQLADFGHSVDIYQDFMVIGSPGFAAPGQSYKGQVYIYQYLSSNWVHIQTLVAPDGNADDRFGQEVDIFEDYIAISAPTKEGPSTYPEGKVYIYKKGSSAWNYLSSVTSLNSERFGAALHLSLHYLIVGDYYKSITSTFQGEVNIYRRTNDNFTLDATLHDPDLSSSAYFGYSIAYNNLDLFISSPQKFINGEYQGCVNRFRKINNMWTHQDEILANNSESILFFGRKLALQNDKLLITSRKSFGNRIYQGAVGLYSYIDNNWCFKAEFTPSDGQKEESFGQGLSIYDNDIFIGSPYKDTETLQNTGAAYFFKKN